MSEASSSGAAEVGYKRPELGNGWRWRILVSILGPVAWLSFTLLYVGFWATGLTLFQSIIVVLVSAIVLGGVMGALWATWGPRYARGWDGESHRIQ
jgi:hypothetical protein